MADQGTALRLLLLKTMVSEEAPASSSYPECTALAPNLRYIEAGKIHDFPDWMLERRRGEVAMTSVVATCVLFGV